MGDDRQRECWPHTAIEALMLFTGPLTSEVGAARMAISELVVRRVLTLTTGERKRLRIFTVRTNVLSPGLAFRQELPEPLASVMVRYRSLAGSAEPASVSGVPVQELARRLFGSARRRTFVGRIFRKQPVDPKGFVETVLLPHSVNRNWLYLANPPSGKLWASPSWDFTAEGATEHDRLHRILTDGRETLPRWVREEPERAAQFIECAGPALLLLPGVAQEIRTLHARLFGQSPLTSPAATKPADRTNPTGAGREAVAAGVFSVMALAGIFGPGEFDGFDSAMFSISEDVSALWAETLTGHGDGG